MSSGNWLWLPPGLVIGDRVKISFREYVCIVEEDILAGGRWAVTEKPVDEPGGLTMAWPGHRSFYLEHPHPGRTVERVPYGDL